jgi:SAM-dependent methyltransferase
MEQQEYASMFQVENKHFWYHTLRKNICLFLSPYFPKTRKKNALRIFDAGCGTGANLVMLQEYGQTFGLDFAPEAVQFCKTRGLTNLMRGTVTTLPVKSESIDILCSFDVICHQSIIDDIDALAEFYRVLKPDGLILLNLPAYQFLYSTHDIAVHTQRRYTKSILTKKLNQVGFKTVRVSYWNTFLFPLLASIRLIKKMSVSTTTIPESDVKPVDPIVNSILRSIYALESGWLKSFNLSAGLSILCLAKKDN